MNNLMSLIFEKMSRDDAKKKNQILLKSLYSAKALGEQFRSVFLF